MSGVNVVKIDLTKYPELAEDLDLIKRYFRASDYASAIRAALAEFAREIREREKVLSKETVKEVTG